MALMAPFLHPHFQPELNVVFLQDSLGRLEIVARSRTGDATELVYEADMNFVAKYADVVVMGDVLIWDSREGIRAWLDRIIGMSFVALSEDINDLHDGGICWFVKVIGGSDSPNSTDIPLSYQEAFGNSNKDTWVLLKNEMKLWPVCATNNRLYYGWSTFWEEHDLQTGFRVIFGAGKKWIFRIIVLDENFERVYYDWPMVDEEMGALIVPSKKWHLMSHLCTVYNPIDPDSPRSGGAYQMNTRDGRSEIVALAINTGGDHLYYSALPSFIQNYGGIIPLGNDTRWNIKRCFVAWMESIIYHSFLHHSLVGVENCWFMKDVSAYSLTTLTTIPIGFRNTFNGDNQTIWILLKHGKKAWPVQVINNVFFAGWASFHRAHALRPNFGLVFATERKWIFNVFILNENNVEVQFPWSQPNPTWVNLFPIPAGLVTSRILSVFANQQSSKKFGHQYVAGNHVAPVFQGQLRDLIHENPSQQLTMKVGNFVWVVPIHNGYLHYLTLE